MLGAGGKMREPYFTYGNEVFRTATTQVDFMQVVKGETV